MNQPVQNTTIIMSQPGPPQKSLLAAIGLAFIFGPLGMLYATAIGGVVMFFVTIIVAIFTLGIGLLITHPICVIWAALAVNKQREQQAAMVNQSPQSSVITTGTPANQPVGVVEQKPKEPTPPSVQ